MLSACIVCEYWKDRIKETHPRCGNDHPEWGLALEQIRKSLETHKEHCDAPDNRSDV